LIGPLRPALKALSLHSAKALQIAHFAAADCLIGAACLVTTSDMEVITQLIGQAKFTSSGSDLPSRRIWLNSASAALAAAPGINRLAEDPEIKSAMILTDGYIYYPTIEPSYRLLWVLIGDLNRSFDPPYGEVMEMELRR
jgi:hypothetical protein